MHLTTLDALLLFLTSAKNQSGYDIRQLFQSSPVGMFSDSPGAIYPALARLEMRGLLASAAEDGGRRRRAYRLTEAGERGLRAWLTAPIAPEAVVRRVEDLDLRFVIVAETLGREAARTFLAEYVAALDARQHEVIEFRAGPGQAMSRAPLEALDLGLRLGRARLEWCRELLENYGGTEDDTSPWRRAGA